MFRFIVFDPEVCGGKPVIRVLGLRWRLFWSLWLRVGVLRRLQRSLKYLGKLF